MNDQAMALPAALASPTANYFISPHYDDIAISCGGTARLLADAGRTPRIDVIFGSEPDAAAPLHEFAEELHRAWGLDAATVIASRQAEEAKAASILGATTRVLPFRDAIYRGRHYVGNPYLFGAIAPAESGLPDQVAAALLDSEPPEAGARIYAPLGVGHHVDHQIAFLAGAQLAANDWDVWFYEDLPYAINPGALESRLGELARSHLVEPAVTIDVASVWRAKVGAIVAYASQLETVFDYVGSGHSPADIDETMRAYADRAGGGVPGERFWRLRA
ncbi:MAG TPA: PIG-L family deacetylase [Thermomicrobiales bacterium]|nr:PIG-L family deacetylase [Thermomicrobiales bacterium]